MNDGLSGNSERWIVFFDGTCSFCDGSVRALHRLDRHRRLWFAPLQGETSRRLGLDVDLSPDGTMLLVREENGHALERLERGDALLAILRLLGWPWRWFADLGRLVPRTWRDSLYRVIARNRHRWFGEKEVCELSAADSRPRLLG